MFPQAPEVHNRQAATQTWHALAGGKGPSIKERERESEKRTVTVMNGLLFPGPCDVALCLAIAAESASRTSAHSSLTTSFMGAFSSPLLVCGHSHRQPCQLTFRRETNRLLIEGIIKFS
jgi:hypothetical protein